MRVIRKQHTNLCSSIFRVMDLELYGHEESLRLGQGDLTMQNLGPAPQSLLFGDLEWEKDIREILFCDNAVNRGHSCQVEVAVDI